MSKAKKAKAPPKARAAEKAKGTRSQLDPNAPGLDEMTRRRRHALAAMQRMTPKELFLLAVRAGIYTKTGELAKPYRKSGGPSAARPAD